MRRQILRPRKRALKAWPSSRTTSGRIGSRAPWRCGSPTCAP